jgi:hypothetical protein
MEKIKNLTNSENQENQEKTLKKEEIKVS